MPQLTIRNVDFSFRQDPVLVDVNLHVANGQFVSILGASGCGKSTLLRLIAGLVQPDRGDILIGDSNPANGSSGDETSFVFQKPTLCPWLTVQKNVELPLKLRGQNKVEREQATRQAIELVGLSERDSKKWPKQLSGGMQMRVSLARAFVTRPRLMLMDEPFSALDEVLRQQLTETCLEHWHREAWTTVFVTHNVAEAAFLSQSILILAGKPATIVKSIAVPFEKRDRNLRVSAEFAGFVSDVSRQLRDAVELSMQIGGVH